ncbi:deoxyuridine 5`-triphosphate nucleotidohydrolase [Clostridium sp. CAG:575]|nr:deoxyuridine 5`-triphosphate nucleotidohydrolase [Clostridium sp. CAG:575]
MRDFEKISFEQFKKDVTEDINLYNEYELPQRDSDSTAGYDIYLLQDLIIEPNEIKKIPTGIKSFFEKDEVLFLIVRSSTGFKYNIRLCNQVGVIDADYYNNQNNEGHIWLKIQNEGKEKVIIPQGEAIVQGIFLKYLTTQSDKDRNIKRTSDY